MTKKVTACCSFIEKYLIYCEKIYDNVVESRYFKKPSMSRDRSDYDTFDVFTLTTKIRVLIGLYFSYPKSSFPDDWDWIDKLIDDYERLMTYRIENYAYSIAFSLEKSQERKDLNLLLLGLKGDIFVAVKSF